MKECYCIYCDKGKCTNEKTGFEDCVCVSTEPCDYEVIKEDKWDRADNKYHERREK